MRLLVPAREGGLEERVAGTVARRFGSQAVALTDSGTSALTLALRLTRGSAGRVAMPAYACIDLATAAMGAGVQVVLYDLDPATLSPDEGSFRDALQEGVDAVVLVHLFGYPADVEHFASLARAAGARVIEDAAQGAGGSLRGQSLGSYGELAILSFGRGKGTSAGGGGALLANTAEWGDAVRRAGSGLVERAAGAVKLAIAGAQWALGRPSLYWLPSALPMLRLGEMVFHEPHPPQAMPLAAMLLAEGAIASGDAAVMGRSERARRLAAVAAGHGVPTPPPLDGAVPGYLRLPVLATHPAGGRLLGVVRPYPVSLATHEAMRRVLSAQRRREWPGAERLARELYTIPVHHFVNDDDERALGEWLGSAGLRRPTA